MVLESSSSDAGSPSSPDRNRRQNTAFRYRPRFQTNHGEATGIKWQRNYIDHRLRDDESLAEKADYILNNPVRAGFVSSVDEWSFLLRGDSFGRDD